MRARLKIQAPNFVFLKTMLAFRTSYMPLTVGVLLIGFLPVTAQVIAKGGTQIILRINTTLDLRTPMGVLAVESGAAFQNDGTIQLSPTGSVSEQAGFPIYGLGTESITKNLSAVSVAENPGSLGAELDCSTALGTTTITRGHTSLFTNGGGPAILRWFDIAPANNSLLDATLKFHYDETELNGNTEALLNLFESQDAGSTWSNQQSSTNATSNIITASSINSLALHSAQESTVGIPEFEISPNPASDWLSIALNSPPAGTVTIDIIGLNGQQVSAPTLVSSAVDFIKEVDVHDLAIGIYIVRFSHAEMQVHQKLLISR